MKEVGLIIRSLRSAKGYSQEYVSNELGIKQAAYSNIESGKSDVTVKRLQQIANLLDVSILDFFGYSNSLISEQNENNSTKPKGYELSITIKLNDPSKEQQILNLMGLK